MKRRFLPAIPFLLSFWLFSACSLDYGTTYSLEETYPELVLKEAILDRMEKGKLTAEVQCQEMEQYKSGEKIMAKDIDFSVLDENGNPSSQGKAGYLYGDMEKELYEFFDNIEIKNAERNIVITTDSLRWNGKTEQLTGEKDKPLTIKKGNTTLSGTGFSASAISNTFSFSKHVNGTIEEE